MSLLVVECFLLSSGHSPNPFLSPLTLAGRTCGGEQEGRVGGGERWMDGWMAANAGKKGKGRSGKKKGEREEGRKGEEGK